MRKFVWIILLAFLFSATAVYAQNQADVVAKIYNAIGRLDNLTLHNLKVFYSDGKIKEVCVNTNHSVDYVHYYSNGKVYEHYNKTKTGVITYERFFETGMVAERFFKDGRVTVYNNFWSNGQTKEHYSYEKKTNKTEYYMYNSKGKVVSK